jgi:hypothetical protein
MKRKLTTHLAHAKIMMKRNQLSPKSGDTTNIVWNVVDKSLSTLFKKTAMRARFGQSIVQTLSIALAMKVMYSAMVSMYNAIKVIDNAMINITYA